MRRHGRGKGPQQGHGRGRRKGQVKILHVACLLQLIHQDLHGYELLQELGSDQTLNRDIDPSIIYRIMREFEGDGLVGSYEGNVSKGPQRRMYRLTASGREQLAIWMQELEAMQTDIGQLMRRYAG